MILEKFGWTWQYLTWGVRFPLVQRMMADAPWYEYSKTGGKKENHAKAITMTDDNTDEIMKLFNTLPR